MDEECAFWVALRLLNYHNLQCLYSSSAPFLPDYLKHFHCYCERTVPALVASFAEKGFLTTFYAVEVGTAAPWLCACFPTSGPLALVLCDVHAAALTDTPRARYTTPHLRGAGGSLQHCFTCCCLVSMALKRVSFQARTLGTEPPPPPIPIVCIHIRSRIAFVTVAMRTRPATPVVHHHVFPRPSHRHRVLCD